MSPRNRKNFYAVSLGCPKNLSDLEVLSGGLLAAGWTLTTDPENADAYLINTCAFIPAARNEAFDEIRKGVVWKNGDPRRKLAVAGCLSVYDADGAVRRMFPQVDFWLGIDDIVRADRVFGGETPSFSKILLADETAPRIQLTLPHLAYLKIADGCVNCCTFCAIPRLRGRLRSLPVASVVAQARERIEAGVKELVVVAQDTTSYGLDRKSSGETLAGLLGELDRIDGDFVIRVLYTHPAHYSRQLIDVIHTGSKILPYLDIPLQHISDPMLKAMNRHVTRKDIETLIGKLRREIPGVILRSTFIAGFPGETEAQFEELCDFCRDAKFERMGVFPFSAEPGTPAAALSGQIPVAVAEERATLLMKRQIARMQRVQKKRIGSVEKVLVDACGDGVAWARGVADAPEIDNLVLIDDPRRRCKPGVFAEVEITGTQNCDVVARTSQKKRK
ncbi:MAG: 30S ribosomal protein S12 methylthiotransferase RimO [Victivallaceae bacterium]|nr:30S ribosomal protein S12 methylthiotransferase RimO [Victivallaceae bacterium]